jgi:hypothetical protein
MDPREFADAYDSLQGMTPEERARWAALNAAELTDAQFEQLLRVDSADVVFQKELYNAREQATDRAAAQAATARVDSQFDASVRDPASPGGSNITPEEAEAREAAGGTGIDFVDPRWLMDANNGSELTDEQRDYLLEYYNGTSEGSDFQSYEELVDSGALDTPAGQNQALAEAAFGEPEPYPTLSIGVSKGKQFTVRSDEWEEAASRYGFSSDEMTRIVRLADMNNMRGADGEYIAWQPLAALMKTTGALDRLDTREGQLDRVSELNTRITALTRQVRGMSGPEVDSAAARSARSELDRLKLQRDEEIAKARGLLTAPEVGPRALANAYNEGLNLYGYDPGMAFIHATDAGLAARFASAGGDPDKISGADQALMLRHLGNAGYLSEEDFAKSIISQGYTEAGLVGSFIQGQQRRASGGGGGRERILPDPVQVQQAAKDLYRSLFKEEPDEATLTSLSQQVNAAIAGSPDNQNVDVEARIRQTMEGLPQYDKYYGNKPGGMTEGEYQGQFVDAQQSILGNELAGNSAVRLGMQSGQYQTAVGAATGTKEAWGSSTWLGRLAAAAQNVARNT